MRLDLQPAALLAAGERRPFWMRLIVTRKHNRGSRAARAAFFIHSPFRIPNSPFCSLRKLWKSGYNVLEAVDPRNNKEEPHGQQWYLRANSHAAQAPGSHTGRTWRKARGICKNGQQMGNRPQLSGYTFASPACSSVRRHGRCAFRRICQPVEAAPNALPYSSSPPKKTSCFLGSFAFAISTLSMLLPWILNKATLSFLYGACCSIFFSILAGILLHHFIAACRNSQLPCPHMRKWVAVASAAFAAHAAALGIVRLCASYRMDYAFTVLVACDPVYGLVSSGIAAAAALWVWKRIP